MLLRVLFMTLVIMEALVIALVQSPNLIAPFKLDFDVHRGSFDLVKRSHTIDKRLGVILLGLNNTGTLYIAQLAIGSLGDLVEVAVDTGSSDLWVASSDVQCFSDSSTFKDVDLEKVINKNILKQSIIEGKEKRATGTVAAAAASGAQVFTAPTGTQVNTCTQYGSFATSNSDTFKRNETAKDFYISYTDGSAARGIWGEDTIRLGKSNNIAEVQGLTFAVANKSSSHIGVLGIGYGSLESLYQDSGYIYENLPQKMKSLGLISKNAYSLYLHVGENIDTGSVLFGAVDHAKYKGDLQTVPILGYLSKPSPIETEINPGPKLDQKRISISLTGLQYEDEVLGSSLALNISDNYVPALVDTGSTLSVFPRSLLDQIGAAAKGTFSDDVKAYDVPCSGNENASITFEFSGAIIKVPYNTLLVQMGDVCYLGITQQTSSTPYIVLGDNFLRSAYVVFDLDDSTVSLAQANYTTHEDIENISDSIPGATKVLGFSLTRFGGTSSSTTTSDSAYLGTGLLTEPGHTSSNSKKSLAPSLYIRNNLLGCLTVVISLIALL